VILGIETSCDETSVALVDAAHRLTHVFKRSKLDIEWVFVGDQLYIVQSRPLVAAP